MKTFGEWRYSFASTQHYNPAHTHRTNIRQTTYSEGKLPSLELRARPNESKNILFLTKHILYVNVLTLGKQHKRVIHVKHFL
jgi:hypothetical protein